MTVHFQCKFLALTSVLTSRTPLKSFDILANFDYNEK